MSKRHTITSVVMTLFILLPAIAILLYEIDAYAPEILIVTIVMVVLGLAVGATLPGILTTWIIILLTVIGGGILLFGDVPISGPLKLIILVIFPISAGLMSIVRFTLIKFGWVSINKSVIERYAQHYDRTTKLQTQYNAEKMYRKIVHFIQDDYDQGLWFTVTGIQWANSDQFKQFHAADYNKTLREIAKVLKEDRLPSESLYYLDHGIFLIVSHQLPEETYQKRNEFTKSHLDQLKCFDATPQFKWGSLQIDRSNVDDFLTLKDVAKLLERQMETDLVIEYLKGDDSR